MKTILKACLSLLLVAVAGGTGTANADDDHPRRLFIERDVDTFAVLPEGAKFPEGITANPWNGDIYVGTFEGGAENKLLRFDRRGRLEATRKFGITPLLGLEFDRINRKVYIANVGNFVGMASKIQRIAANFHGGTAIEDVAVIPLVNAPAPRTVGNPDGSSDTIFFGTGARVPNAMVLNRKGTVLYISDSFQGAIFTISNPATCNPCNIEMINHDPLLATAGFPPFGANGLALSYDEKTHDETTLFIANTGDDRVLKLDLTVPPLTPNSVSIFAESINGADGLAIDRHGRVWVAANQADEVVALNAKGKIVAKLGEFRGVRGNGTPNGLLFPASLVIVDDEIFVTNLALPLTGTAGDEPEEDVSRWTVSRLKMPRH